LSAALGLRPAAPIAAIAYPLAATALLFALSLLLKLQEGSLGRALLGLRCGAARLASAAKAGTVARTLWASLQSAAADEHLCTWRNLVAAPLSEEWVFRACMAPLLVLQVGAPRSGRRQTARCEQPLKLSLLLVGEAVP